MLCPYLPVMQVKTKNFKADNFYLLLLDSFPKMLILGLMYNMALSLRLKYPKKIIGNVSVTQTKDLDILIILTQISLEVGPP